jgi:hypothetical protein
MRTLVLALLAALVASPADAQLGRILDRAKQRVEDAVSDRAPDPPPAESEAATATPTAPESSAAPVSSSDSEAAPVARTGPAPGADAYDLIYHALPHVGNGRANGNGPFALVFPVEATYEIAVLDAAGAIVSSDDWDIRPNQDLPMFAHLSVPFLSTYEPVPGSYQIAIRLNGETIAAVPYTLTSTQNDDPFNPTTSWHTDGPWTRYGVLRATTGDPDGWVELTCWIHVDELAGDAGEVRPVVYRGSERISAHEGGPSLRKSFGGWYGVKTSLDGDYEGRPGRLLRDALVDGDYRIEVGEEGQPPLRVFHFSVAGGQFVPHERSAIDYEPRADFLTPRSVRERTTRGLYEMVDQVWMISE